MILLAGLNSLNLGGQSPVPPEYTALQYIECGLDTGTPQIVGVSGIGFNDTINLSCEFLQPVNGANWLFFFYTWDFSVRSFKLEGYRNSALHRWCSTTMNEQDTDFISGPLELTCSKSVCELNGVNYPVNCGTSDTSADLGRIFHFALPQSCRAYSFDVIDSNGVYTHHLIPCKRNADNVLGFYDTVVGNFRGAVNNEGWTIAGPAL